MELLTERNSMYKFRLLLIIYIHFITNISANKIDFCAKSWNVTCVCEYSMKGLHFYCPQRNNVQIEVFLTEEYIKMECDEAMTVDDYAAISTINLSAINRLGERIFTHEKFIFINCVIPPNGFEDMIQKLKGSERPNQLYFDNCLPTEIIDRNHRIFRREHFNGFSEIVALGIRSTRTETLTLSPNAFDYVTNIFKLRLILPQLHDMNGELFRNQRKLKDFELIRTPVNLNKEFFVHVSSISALYVIQSVQPNTLSSTAFHLLRDVKRLEMTFNNLTTLPSGLFHSNQQLETLRIVEPALSSQPHDLLANLKYLTDFTLSSTAIETIHVDYFETTTQLTSIDLSGNKLTSLPDELFRNLNKLLTINLANNKLKQLPTSLGSALISLRSMYLNNNSLTTYPTFGFSSAHFNVLDLSGNQIERISSADLRFPAPSTIYLNDNLLATINFSDITSTLRTLQSVNGTISTALHLDGNPFNCNGSLVDFINYMYDPDQLFGIYIVGGECSLPSHLAKLLLLQIDADALMHQKSNSSSKI